MALRRAAVLIATVIGLGLISAGIALVYVPAALVVTGAYLAGGAIFLVDIGGEDT